MVIIEVVPLDYLLFTVRSLTSMLDNVESVTSLCWK